MQNNPHVERYVGETLALRHFLSELLPLVEKELGSPSVLEHKIRTCLSDGSLPKLREARTAFHRLPTDTKKALMRGIFS